MINLLGRVTPAPRKLFIVAVVQQLLGSGIIFGWPSLQARAEPLVLQLSFGLIQPAGAHAVRARFRFILQPSQQSSVRQPPPTISTPLFGIVFMARTVTSIVVFPALKPWRTSICVFHLAPMPYVLDPLFYNRVCLIKSAGNSCAVDSGTVAGEKSDV